MATKESKRLSIRGGQLLLALDALTCWADYPENEQPQFNRNRVNAVLSRWWSEENRDRAQHYLGEAFAAVLWPIHGFLRSLSDHVAATELPIAVIEAFLYENAVSAEDARAIAGFLSAIASGELTEEDFKEVA